MLDAFDAAATHSLAFNHYNIHKCIKGHIKQDCFSAIDDVQKAKQILKNEKNISKHDKDLTVFQCYLLQQIGTTGIKEDVLRFWTTPLGKNFLEDIKKYDLIKKRD